MAIQPGEPTFTFNALGIEFGAPAASGVYAICAVGAESIYFGESNNIQRRLLEHLDDPYDCVNASSAALFAVERYPTNAARVRRQNQLIVLYSTVCNQMFG